MHWGEGGGHTPAEPAPHRADQGRQDPEPVGPDGTGQFGQQQPARYTENLGERPCPPPGHRLHQNGGKSAGGGQLDRRIQPPPDGQPVNGHGAGKAKSTRELDGRNPDCCQQNGEMVPRRGANGGGGPRGAHLGKRGSRGGHVGRQHWKHGGNRRPY